MVDIEGQLVKLLEQEEGVLHDDEICIFAVLLRVASSDREDPSDQLAVDPVVDQLVSTRFRADEGVAAGDHVLDG